MNNIISITYNNVGIDHETDSKLDKDIERQKTQIIRIKAKLVGIIGKHLPYHGRNTGY